MSDKNVIPTEPNWMQRIMAHYGYSRKINVIFFLNALITAFICYFLVSDQLSQIRFAERELKGIQYQRSIGVLIQEIVMHKILANHYPVGDKSFSNDMIQLQNKIHINFKELERTHEELKNDLNILFLSDGTQKFGALALLPEEIERQWNEFSSNILDLSVEQINQKHGHIIDSLQLLLSEVGDRSNLFFDPFIETHYLVTSTFDTLPEQEEIISKIIILSEEIINTGQPTRIQEYELTTLTSVLATGLTNTQIAIEKSINEGRSDLKNQLQRPLNEYIESINNLTAFINTLLLQPEGTTDIKLAKSDTNYYLSELNMLGSKALGKNHQLWEDSTDIINTILGARISTIKMSGYIILACMVTALGIVGYLGYFVLSEINIFFRDVYAAVYRFGQGDLSSRAPNAYDTSLQKMSDVLNDIAYRIESLVNHLETAGVQLTITTTQIAAAAKHQEGTVCQQEATVKQILITAGEISSIAQEFAKTMNEVSFTAEETSALASSGKDGLASMESTIRLMVEASKNIASKLAVLNEKAGAITSVITTITKVADQTNLLSLNAAIEAEKAGEHGKSFGVIAREIRRLADQTASATLDIEKMVTEMMSAVSEGVMGVDKFREEIRTGVEQVSTVSEQLTMIIEQVQQQTVSYEKVNTGMKTQLSGAEQINESIMQLSDAAQETTNSIRQFHSAIDQLTIATKDMQVSVSKVKK